MTLARGADEEALIAGALHAAAGSGLPVVACDGGSREAFLSQLRAIRGVSVVSTPIPGLVAQVKESVRTALAQGADRVLYVEPDKDVFLTRHAEPFLRAAGSDPGLFVAARTAAAFQTFPAIQQFTESTINTLTSEAVGVAGDYSYGPMLLPRAAAEHALRAPERIGWGWRHFVAALAHRSGLPIALHTGPYDCPLTQRQQTDHERIHRLKQLAQNIDGLVEGLTADL